MVTHSHTDEYGAQREVGQEENIGDDKCGAPFAHHLILHNN